MRHSRGQTTAQTTVAVAGAALMVAALAGCTGGVGPEVGEASMPPGQNQTQETMPSPGDGMGTPSDAPGATNEAPGAGGEVTQDDAARIATEKYGGTVKSVEDDHHNGEATWEVELRDSSQGRIEVEVSKATGEIVSMELDD